MCTCNEICNKSHFFHSIFFTMQHSDHKHLECVKVKLAEDTDVDGLTHWPSLTVSQFSMSYMSISCMKALARMVIASYPGRVGGERQPGIDCLRIRDHSQKILGIRLHLEIVGKINTYTFDIFLYYWKIQPFASWITFHSMNVEDNSRVYEAKDAFLRLPTSFGRSVHYEVVSFACLTVSKAS